MTALLLVLVFAGGIILGFLYANARLVRTLAAMGPDQMRQLNTAVAARRGVPDPHGPPPGGRRP